MEYSPPPPVCTEKKTITDGIGESKLVEESADVRDTRDVEK
jgi:hypothetical protein